MITSLVWFRLDLRLADNPALADAAARGAVVPVFFWSPEEEGAWPTASASKWWLHQSLLSLDVGLRKLGSRLIVRRGPALPTLLKLAREVRACAVFWNRRYEPALIERDGRVKAGLKQAGLITASSNGSMLHEPWTLMTKQGRPFQVYTPYWNAIKAAPAPNEPIAPPRTLDGPAVWPESLPLEELKFEPVIDWAGGMRDRWTPGEAGAWVRLGGFLDRSVDSYHECRDRPDLEGTSSISPHLHFGEIGPRQIWHAVRNAARVDDIGQLDRGKEVFLKELVWREFGYQLLYHFPRTPDEPLREEFSRFPWKHDAAALRAWQRGRTGYPMVDAGMRQLWSTGWMHNRVRMVVASFLVKHLLIPWQDGARWFWDTLVDADLASNTLGWQWTAGCGADAAPYFRIFNPVSQGEKFDPSGHYVRRWVPELAGVPEKFVHCPWEAPSPPTDYPPPLVELAFGRERALAALATITKNKGAT